MLNQDKEEASRAGPVLFPRFLTHPPMSSRCLEDVWGQTHSRRSVVATLRGVTWLKRLPGCVLAAALIRLLGNPRLVPIHTIRQCPTTDRLSRLTTGRCVVSDRNLACAILIRRKTPPDGEVKMCLLP